MDRERFKINMLTRIKSSLGIDTRSDEIAMGIDELKKEQQRVGNKIENLSGKISVIDSILSDIDKIYELAESDLLKGFADDFSIKIMAYNLSIERAKRQNLEISKVVEMQQNYSKIVRESTIGYINSIMNNIEYFDGNYKTIKILISNISSNLNRIRLSANFTCYQHLEKIKEYLLDKKLNLTGTRNSYSDANNSLRSQIVGIETSREKYLADYAKELAEKKKKR